MEGVFSAFNTRSEDTPKLDDRMLAKSYLCRFGGRLLISEQPRVRYQVLTSRETGYACGTEKLDKAVLSRNEHLA